MRQQRSYHSWPEIPYFFQNSVIKDKTFVSKILQKISKKITGLRPAPSPYNLRSPSTPNWVLHVCPQWYWISITVHIAIPYVNAPESYPSHIMHRNLTHHTWMHRNHQSSNEYTEFVPLKHECTEIIIPQVSAPESYPSHMNAPKSSILRWKHRNPTLNTWKYRNHDPSSKYTGLSLTLECTKIITPQVNAPTSYPSHLNAPKSSSLK